MNKIALQQKLPVIVLFTLIAAMVFTLSLQAYYFFEPLTIVSPAVDDSVKRQASPITRPQRDLDKYELFGKPVSQNQQQVAIKTENLPKTNLRLVLRGVSASSDIERVSALIEGPDKDTLKYAINDKLPGNAKLKSVHEKRIVIERNGRLENLYFPEDANIGIVRNQGDKKESPTPIKATTPLSQKPLQIPQVPKNFSRPAANLDTLSEQRKQEIKDRLEQLREKMKQQQ